MLDEAIIVPSSAHDLSETGEGVGGSVERAGGPEPTHTSPGRDGGWWCVVVVVVVVYDGTDIFWHRLTLDHLETLSYLEVVILAVGPGGGGAGTIVSGWGGC